MALDILEHVPSGLGDRPLGGQLHELGGTLRGGIQQSLRVLHELLREEQPCLIDDSAW
ncbi:hypothetical protein [Ideonella paludis]|uniref:hypothetical protein n=1 Tax=Ideonella paludis TaxID=1233411 RepID=UPI0036295ED0